MADDTLMDLIDAYAEARHVGGCHTYNAKTAEARAKVVASLAASAGSEPVATAAQSALESHPSPPEGMAGWKWVPTVPTNAMLHAAVATQGPDGVTPIWHAYQAMIAAAPPLPASEAKEL